MAGLRLGLGLEAMSSRLGLAHGGARARASPAGLGLGLYLESDAKPAILHYSSGIPLVTQPSRRTVYIVFRLISVSRHLLSGTRSVEQCSKAFDWQSASL